MPPWEPPGFLEQTSNHLGLYRPLPRELPLKQLCPVAAVAFCGLPCSCSSTLPLKWQTCHCLLAQDEGAAWRPSLLFGSSFGIVPLATPEAAPGQPFVSG